ncbi:MAG: hypothetical protein MUF49_21795, partial [Oculatellaceae cyanobacterium Prado106]|nr:hypothetical protein [Oculatellaceae cyanobacterium Prado106]
RLDQELQLYYRYLQRYGRPDVMIVGSSRSLQGVDPTALRESLAAQGYPNAKVYNFGINGATAQVMQLLLTEVLAPEQLPKMLIWGDGSRAFNSGRRDITYNGIVASAGYRHLQAGYHPIPTRIFSTGSIPVANQSKTADLSPEPAIAPDLDRYGFNPLSDRYDPQTYYQRFPVVLGRYDSNYQDFQLWGNQSNATVAIADFAKTYQIPLIFVSLPLTDDYLADPTRSQYEQRFHQHMGELARQRGFTFIDYHQHPNLIQNNFFVDPSHINRYGAAAVAQQLAADAQIPWQILRTP